MDDPVLLKLSFGVATFGLVLLFIVSSYSEAPVVEVSALSYDDAGTKVAIKGEVTKVRFHKDGHIFLEVTDRTGEISIAIFKNVVEKLDEKKMECITNIGSNVEISGEVKEYQEEMELIPQSTNDLVC